MTNHILRRLKAPNKLREQVVTLIDKHMTRLEPQRKPLRRVLGRLGEETVLGLLALQEADMGSKGTGKAEEMEQFPRIREEIQLILEENACLSLKDLAVNGRDLMQLGYEGKAIGEALNELLAQVLDEKLPNEKDALLNFLRQVEEVNP
jgi:tRNA nucleotidyltransferase (CCA-adding enzyme)